MDAQQRLAEAIEHGRAGRKSQAQVILAQLIKEDPRFADAWLWMAACFDDPQKQIYCLNKVLEINPQHPRARQALEKLGAAPLPLIRSTPTITPQESSQNPATPPPSSVEKDSEASLPAKDHASSSWISDTDYIDNTRDAPGGAVLSDEEEQSKPHITRYSWWQVWLMATVLSNDENYQAILRDPKGVPSRGYIWILITGLISFLLSALSVSRQLSELPQVIYGSSELPFDISTLLGSSLAGMLLLSPVFAGLSVLGVIISAALYQIAARLLGGKGIFPELVYVLCAIFAPLYLVSSLTSLLPYPASVALGLPISLYVIYLTLKGIKAVNRFGWGSSCITMLAPGLLFGLIGCLCALLVSSMMPDFSNISPDQFPYPLP